MATSNVSLPPSIARHLHLGFDSDDINALISSIDNSQNHTISDHETGLPQLPVEIIISILHSVPVNYILDWRLVCRGFRDIIDSAVMFSYLPRMHLIGYIGPSIRPEYLQHVGSGGDHITKIVSADTFEDLQLLHAYFHGPIRAGCAPHGCAKWSATSEVCYRIDEKWFKIFEDIGGSVKDRANLPIVFHRVLSRLELEAIEAVPEAYGAIQWCVRLDCCVLDIDSTSTTIRGSSPSLAVDLKGGTIKVSWKDVVWQLLRTENSIRRKMEQTQHLRYTFSHEEDSIRHVRRLRTRHGLDLTNATDRGCCWALRTLEPLFDKRRIDKAGHSWEILEHTEDDSARVLMQLRREFSSTSAHRASLLQLGHDRQIMMRERVELGALFLEWRNNLYCSSSGHSVIYDYSIPKELSPNPFAWSDATRQLVDEEVQRWKSQRKGIESMKSFMQSSNEVLKAPDELWGDLGSD